MELRVLNYFLAVAREQNISAAAEFLHVSQPTLSIQLKDLEDELGKQLLIRGTKGSRRVTLTEEGMILRKRAEEIMDLVKITQKEISVSEESLVGEVRIGAGESDNIRLFAKAAKVVKEKHPMIQFNILSGNAVFVQEQLDRGLIDFGIVYSSIDNSKYCSLKIPFEDTWGVLMRKDSPLAENKVIKAKDLWDKPLILSAQKSDDTMIFRWLEKDISQLNIAATYNLLFNASIMVEEGLGYAVCFDKIINVGETSSLCFRPLNPVIKSEATIIWKRYQVFSKAAQYFLNELNEICDKEEK